MIQLQKGKKSISPLAEERFKTLLDAIEQANPNINWGKYEGRPIVRKYARWRLLLFIFPQRRVMLDIVDLSNDFKITVPGYVFGGPDWKKRGLTRAVLSFRFREMEAYKPLFTRKTTIRLKSEKPSLKKFFKTLWRKITGKGE